MRILLFGNPNAGKSVLFSRLTGIGVITSNYPGTTVSLNKGYMKVGDTRAEVVDYPGIHNMSSQEDPSAYTFEMCGEADEVKTIVVDVVDATNLSHSLYLTLQLIERGVRILIALNLSDEARHKGITIDARRLSEILGVPVVATCGLTGEGIKELVARLSGARVGVFDSTQENRWEKIGEILHAVQTVSPRSHTLADVMGDLSINPLTGLPLAALVIVLTFVLTRSIAEGLITNFLSPFFEFYYLPFIIDIFGNMKPPFLTYILVGFYKGPLESFGILTTGVYIIFVAILPYLLSFYLMLSLLEDTGYLARLSVLADTIAHRVGLHGYSVVPVVLGLGCKVPAIMATRLLETRREKVIATALLLMSAPCMSQTAMIIAIVSPCGGAYLLLVFLFIFAMGLLATLLLNRVMKGEVPELFITIPPYRLPNGRLLTQKLWLRLSSFVYEAIPAIFLGLTIIGILDMAGVIEILSHVLSPFFSFLGLPSDIAPVVVTGFLRKDVSIALLKSYMLSPEQLVIACVFLTLYLPCISTLFIMLRELRLKDTLLVTTLMLGSSFLAGALLRLVLATFQ